MRYLDVDTPKPYSVIGLGTWQFGSREWGYGEAYAGIEAGRIVARARELGITVFDTAEIYGTGRSERILGSALAASGGADGVVVASKVFPVLPTAGVVTQRGVRSAQRLGVRRIDLYQVHWPNPLFRDGTTMRGMRALRAVGLAEEIGVSNYPLARWQHAEVALGSRVLTNQVQLSLLARDPLADLLPWAQQTGHVVIAYSPLGQGMLSGRYHAAHRPAGRIRRLNPLFSTANLDRAAPLLDALRQVATAHRATAAQIALAWVVHHPGVVAIPGASSVAQLESNAAAAGIELSTDEHRALTAAAEAFQPVGGVRGVLQALRP